MFHPPAQQLLEELHGDDILQGRVVGATQNGLEGGMFILVEVEGLKHIVIVAAEHVMSAI